jgi:hypothetical protein
VPLFHGIRETGDSSKTLARCTPPRQLKISRPPAEYGLHSIPPAFVDADQRPLDFGRDVTQKRIGGGMNM